MIGIVFALDYICCSVSLKFEILLGINAANKGIEGTEKFHNFGSQIAIHTYIPSSIHCLLSHHQ